MRGKRIVALVLAGCLTFGQTVLAEELVRNEDKTAEVQAEQESQDSENGDIQSSDETVQNSDAGNEESAIESNVADSQDNVAEESLNDEIEATEVKLYTDQNRVIYNRNRTFSEEMDWKWEIETDNEEVCDVEIQKETSFGDFKYYFVNIQITSKKVGEANITISNTFGTEYKYHVAVAQRPVDSIIFKDGNLEAALLESYRGIDKNQDGVISKSELFEVKSLCLSYQHITDLDGLQYAENLESINLQGNTELKSIEPIAGLKKIDYYNLKDTGIPVAEKWKLVEFNTEINMFLGNQEDLIGNGEFFNDDELTVEKINGDVVGKITGTTVIAISQGDESIKISCGAQSQIINIHVTGVQADQETGESSNVTVTDSDIYTVLDSNGTLWQLYPETKKLNKDIKRYIGGWIYSGKDAQKYAYELHKDNTLWSEDKKLVENVKDVSGHYVLDENDDLIDIYNQGTTVMENVSAWAERNLNYYDEDEREEWCYVLKTDGTLWERKEVGKNETVNEFTQIAENIKAVSENGYLDNAGKYISFSGENNLENVETLPVGYENYQQYYMGTDGHTYYQIWNDWIDLGKINIIKNCGVWGNNNQYCLTDSGELYEVKREDKSCTKIADHVQEIKGGYVGVYRGEDGLWRSFDKKVTGTKENPVVIQEIYNNMNEYHLEDYGVANDYNVTKNGVLFLTHVKEMFALNDYAEIGRIVYAIRTDGTIWNITDVPELVVDLNSGTVVKGDVNGDGEVNVQDLRKILRFVCGKEELDASQQSAADVDVSGEVDIQDLRKILRYVCGKEEAL